MLNHSNFLLLYHGLFVQKLYILLCPHSAKWKIVFFLLYHVIQITNIYVHLTIPLLSSITTKIIFFGLVTNVSSDFVTVSTLNLIENCLLSVVSRALNYEHIHLTIQYVTSQIVFLCCITSFSFKNYTFYYAHILLNGRLISFCSITGSSLKKYTFYYAHILINGRLFSFCCITGSSLKQYTFHYANIE